MDTNESSLCRPGGFALTRQMFQFAGIEIPEAGAADTESTDPAVPLRVIDIGCGTGGTMRGRNGFFDCLHPSCSRSCQRSLPSGFATDRAHSMRRTDQTPSSAACFSSTSNFALRGTAQNK